MQVLDSGFRPSFIVGVWRGGSPVGIAVQELLDYFGVHTDHIAVRTSLYRGPEDRAERIRIHGMQYLIDTINADDGLLIVDDVYDTGLSVQALLEDLSTRARRNTPRDIRIATAFFKPKNNQTDRSPDFYVEESGQWLVFPHELRGLTPDEILDHKAGLAPFAARLRGSPPPG